MWHIVGANIACSTIGPTSQTGVAERKAVVEALARVRRVSAEMSLPE